MKKYSNTMTINGEDFVLNVGVGGKGSFDWRNTARCMLIETVIEKSKDFFESLPENEKELKIDILGEAWKESDRVLQTLYSNGTLDKLFKDVKKEIHRT
jgi:hypothetical protein